MVYCLEFTVYRRVRKYKDEFDSKVFYHILDYLFPDMHRV